MNQQLPEQLDLREDGQVEVHSCFATIQGEGPFAGTPAVFLRLAGCNLQCPWCDTEYTDRRHLLTPQGILALIKGTRINPSDLVVITGGEPYRQNLRKLIAHLIMEGKLRVQVETNGTLFQPLQYSHPSLTIVCSPKGGRINKKLVPHIRALKYVVEAGKVGKDGLPLEHLGNEVAPARPENNHQIYVQPLDQDDEGLNWDNTKAAVRSCMEHGHTLCLQLHKKIGLE